MWGLGWAKELWRQLLDPQHPREPAHWAGRTSVLYRVHEPKSASNWGSSEMFSRRDVVGGLGQALVALLYSNFQRRSELVLHSTLIRAQTRTMEPENTWVVTGGPWAHPEVGCAWGRWWAVNWSTWSNWHGLPLQSGCLLSLLSPFL